MNTNKIERLRKNTEAYRRTKLGVLTTIYHGQVGSSKQKGFPPPAYTLQQFHYRWLCDDRFHRLYNEWVRSGYQRRLKPSIDRIDRRLSYTLENTQLMTWGENNHKRHMETRNLKGPVVQLLNGKEVARYASQREAVQRTGLAQSSISAVINGRRKSTGGYGWKRASDFALV